MPEARQLCLALSLSLLTQFLSCKGSVSSTTVQGCMNYSERESNIQHGEYAQQRALFNFCLNDNLTRIVECSPRVSFRICLSLLHLWLTDLFRTRCSSRKTDRYIWCVLPWPVFFTIRRGKIICTSGSSIIIYYSEHPLIDGVLFCATDT